MACTKDLDLVAYVKGEMAPPEAEAVRLHLPTCVDCQEELGSVEELLGGIGSLPSVAPSEEFAARVTRALGADAGYVKLAKETKRREREETIRQHGWWAWAGKSMKDRMRSAPGWVAAAAVYLITFGALAWVLLKDYRPGTVAPNGDNTAVTRTTPENDVEKPPMPAAKLPFVESRTSATARAQVTPEAAKAIELGLEYLASQQRKDGTWPEGKLWVDAMATLAFLGDGNRSGRGKYGELVSRAIVALLARQGKNGAFDADPSVHALAAVCIAEDTAFTQADGKNEKTERDALDRALEWLRHEQLEDGSWGSLESVLYPVFVLRLGGALGMRSCAVPLERAATYLSRTAPVERLHNQATWLASFAWVTATGLEEQAARCERFLSDQEIDFVAPGAEVDEVDIWTATEALRMRGGDAWAKWKRALEQAHDPVPVMGNCHWPMRNALGSIDVSVAAGVLALEAPYRLPTPVSAK